MLECGLVLIGGVLLYLMGNILVDSLMDRLVAEFILLLSFWTEAVGFKVAITK